MALKVSRRFVAAINTVFNKAFLNVGILHRAVDQNLCHSFRLDQVLGTCGSNDIVVAKQVGKVYSYIGFKDMDANEVASCLLSVPEQHRCFHTVCARQNSPVDFYADIDLPKEENGEKKIINVVDCLYDNLDAINFGPRELVVLEAKHRQKLSYHLHVKGQNTLFSDFRAVRQMAEKVNYELDHGLIDLSSYRNSGTLRTAFSMKHTVATGSAYDGILRPIIAKDAKLKRQISDKLLPADVLQTSLVNRQPNREKKKLRVLRAIPGEKLSNKKKVSSNNSFPEEAKWSCYKQMVAKLRLLPAEASDHYDLWISVGLSLHNFGFEDHIFAEWCRFSMRCPHKYNKTVCAAKWKTFPKDGNWRRGYNYITSTIWKQIQGYSY